MPKGLMTLAIQSNEDFAKWFEEWIEAIQQSRIPAGHLLSEKITSTTETRCLPAQTEAQSPYCERL